MSSVGDALSPLDGRYGDRLSHLSRWFSERSLMKARCEIEIDWLGALGAAGVFPPLNPQEQAKAEALRRDFTSEDYGRIKAIEETTRHDVKACEISCARSSLSRTRAPCISGSPPRTSTT